MKMVKKNLQRREEYAKDQLGGERENRVKREGGGGMFGGGGPNH